MHQDAASLAALIGSRICHDLISPIGAISNGLELVGMTSGARDGPEMQLIQQSCDHAAARIRFFRIAFGTAKDGRPIAISEARKTLADHYAGTRISAEWHIDRDLGRDVTQLAYLSALCLETALPQGGLIGLGLAGNTLTGTARAQTVRSNVPVWSVLNTAACQDTNVVGPPDVQFALLARLCRDTGIDARLDATEARAELRLTLPGMAG